MSAEPLPRAPLRERVHRATLIPRMLVLAAVVPLLMRLPLSRVAALLERVPVKGGRKDADIARMHSAIESALRLGGRFVRRNCLTRSITLYYFLRRSGVDVHLAFGAGVPEGRFAGHCWLEQDGQPLLETRDPRGTFPTFYRIPRSPLPIEPAA